MDGARREVRRARSRDTWRCIGDRKSKKRTAREHKKAWFATGSKTGADDIHHKPRDGFFQ
jgi:hypothetical protein